ncbi:hypothetical protein, conserved [Eimeria praecox]|uniref:Uncharacterized protein n=1 Tax=Eimeria praecox TaxID=51316 RepID=U6G8E6_9EIME|nr:hypothetical protein, conserved [Eimeria praecox]
MGSNAQNSKFRTRGGDDVGKFNIEMPKPLRFEELEKLVEERRKEREAQASLTNEETEDKKEEARDPLKDNRIHCWVLVRAGTRNVASDLFIDPPSGRIYEQKKSPFLSVHFLWNQENFWVNMRPKLKAQDLSFSLSNTRFFESALCMPPKPETRDTQLAEFGSDQKTQHLNADGLVRCLTFYSDTNRNLPEEIRSLYKHRRDGLEERIFWPISGRQVERYARGNPHALREVVTVYGERRELHFYKSRLDGLVKHVERFGVKISEGFDGRDDGLIEHSLKFEDISETNKDNESINHPQTNLCFVLRMHTTSTSTSSSSAAAAAATAAAAAAAGAAIISVESSVFL